MDRLEKLIRPVFNLELDYKIQPGLVTLGKYDGTHPCLTAATTTDRVLIHSPHRRNSTTTGRILWSEANKEIATLNLNQKITCLCVGMILPDDEKDILIIGTSTHLLGYHVHDNKDVFYKDCPDGVQSITVGTFQKDKSMVLMVGGNSSVHGLDHTGNEIFWTAVGDIATSLVLMDYNKDGSNELIVSSEDFNIRVYNGDQVIQEYVETEVVTNLLVLPENRFAYTVSNGTVGVYGQDCRLWRVKSKHMAIAIHFYDLLSQSAPQLITGWSNGKIDCRSIKTGEVFFKNQMSSGIAGIVEGDYRSIGKADVICVSISGEVRGFTTTKTLTGDDSRSENDIVRELLDQKQALLMELKQYEYNANYNDNALCETESFEDSGVIPANTRLQIAINTTDRMPNPHVEIYLSTNNSTIIKTATIFAEGIFKGESHVEHPPLAKLKSEMSIPLFLPKDNPADIHIKTMVGYPKSIQFHVFEITRQLPRFSMYCLKTTGDLTRKPDSYIQFKVNDRLQRICIWINQNFLLPTDIEFETGPSLVVNLKCLRDNTDLVMVFEISGRIHFYTDNMTLAVDLVQSMASYLKIENLESQGHFPNEETKLKDLMEKLTDIQDARSKLNTDIADKLSQIRYLVIKAEDSRMNDLQSLPEHYKELQALNEELIAGYNIRLQNYNEGVETMKKINGIFQLASRLRVGTRSANVINQCRNCIKSNNTEGLLKIIRSGDL